ncbi:MAG: sulfotransferase family protein [Cycloclasticus sp.]|nr:sulfotransferase family protein [Cycloclasticus sp.]
MIINLKKLRDSWKRNRKIQRETPEVWLLKDLNVAYIQIPKVATRSIQQCLANYYADCEGVAKPLSWDKEWIKSVEKKTAFHATRKELHTLSANAFVFAFVRNPYGRLYSAYKNKILQPLDNGEKNIFWNHGMTLGMEFGEFVDIVCAIPDEKIDRHLRSQSWFLTYEGSVIPEFIGHLESFDEDWSELNKLFNLGKPAHKNSTVSLNTENHLEGYDSELENKVFKRYQADFEFFNYERLYVNSR